MIFSVTAVDDCEDRYMANHGSVSHHANLLSWMFGFEHSEIGGAL